jgi:hypothetical protein
LLTSVCSTDWEAITIPEARSPSQQDALAQRKSKLSAEDVQSGRTGRTLGLSFLGLRTDRDLGMAESRRLSPGFLLPFEIISVHLLVVLVGAAYLARTKRRPAGVIEDVG